MFPSVSVICPVKGLDYGFAENVQAMKEMSYPGEWELIFVLDDDKDPAYSVVKNERVIFCGQPNGKTGKLNAMARGLEVAKGELVAFVDSDVRPHKSTLSMLVSPFGYRREGSFPKVGASFGRAKAILPPKTMGDAGYSVLLNGLYDAAASKYFLDRETAPFIMGQFMVISREALDKIGGLSSADGQLVDDMFIGRKLNEFGYVIKPSYTQVPIVHNGLKFSEFIQLFRKWMAFSRFGLPWGFKRAAAELPLLVWVGVLGIVFWSLFGATWAAGIGAGIVGGACLLTSMLSSPDMKGLGGWKNLASLLVILLAPFVFLSLRFKRKVSWRGRDYDITSNGVLDEKA